MTNPAKTVSQIAVEDGEAKLFCKDSLFFVGIGATIGKIGIVCTESSCNQQINVIKIEDGIGDYFYYHLLVIKDEIIKFA